MIAYVQSFIQPGAIPPASAIQLAALPMKGDCERLIKEGFDGYLEKPIRYQEFQARVTALLKGEDE